MALTREQALKQALMQQQGSGAKGPIDEAYVKTLMTGQDNGYTQGIIDTAKKNIPSIPNTNRRQEETNPLISALTQTTTAPTKPKDTNLTDLMTQQSKAQTDATLAAIRQRIAESKANQQSLIDKASQQYDPMRAQSEVAKSQQLISSLERSANMGDRGGIGRQEALTTQTEGENRLNQINLQQQNFVDSANAEISRLENEGKYKEAQAVYDQKAKELDALMNESVRQEGIARDEARYQYGIGQDQQALATNEARYQQEQQQYRDSQSQNQQDKMKNEFINTISRFANDYQAQINRVKNDGDTSNDWQLGYLEQARQGKLGDIAKGQSEQQSSLYKMAMDKWESGIPVNSQEANALGVGVGSTKPVKSSGGGGLTNAQEWQRLKDKIDMGIPLTAQEQSILGGTPTQTGKPISDTFAISGIDEIVKRYPVTNPKNLGEYIFKSGTEASRQKQLANELTNFFQQLSDSGYPERELKLLATRYGIDLGGNSQIQNTTN